MKIFEEEEVKLNFVDDNNVFVGYDYTSDCCECFGYYFGRNVGDRIEKDEQDKIDLSGFNFDTSYMVEFGGDDDDKAGYYDPRVMFKLVNGDEEMYLTLYNSHNGYYSHGFEMTKDEELVHSGSL